MMHPQRELFHALSSLLLSRHETGDSGGWNHYSSNVSRRTVRRAREMCLLLVWSESLWTLDNPIPPHWWEKLCALVRHEAFRKRPRQADASTRTLFTSLLI